MSKTEDDRTFTPYYPTVPQHDFEVIKWVGAGGYRTVCKDTWKANGEEMAVKKVAVLKEEADVLSRIRHRSVIEFHGVSEDVRDKESEPCIVTEYADGGFLYDYFDNANNTTTDFKQIITWALQIAYEVDYLHHDAPEP